MNEKVDPKRVEEPDINEDEGVMLDEVWDEIGVDVDAV